MKKLFSTIVVLGLLLSGSAFGLSNQEIINKYLSNKKLDPIEGSWKTDLGGFIIWKENNQIYIQTDFSETCGHKYEITKDSDNVYKYRMNGYKKNRCKFGRDVLRFTLYLDSNKSSGEGKFSVNGSHHGNYNFSRLWPDDIVSHNAKYKTDEDIKNDEKELALIVNDVKKTCGILGFEPGSEKFADCTLKLYTQKIDEKIAAKQEANNRSLQTSSTTTQSSSGTNTTIIYDPVRDKQNKIDRGMKMLGGKCTLGVDC